ncbi:MAG: HAMP domain-containing protein [Candidatus Eisenbacteria bacterium]|nr:HAMP domain-containing protein [Candidatus Eisenbacteria bacterium]
MEMKVVLLVTAAVVVQDLLLVIMYVTGVQSSTIQIVIAGVLILSIVLAAVWGNALARAVRRLTRACYVARKGDIRVLSELTRTDEIGQLNEEINRLIEQLKELSIAQADLASSRTVIAELDRSAPEITRSSHEILVSLKELREGASAELTVLRKTSGCIGQARSMISGITAETVDYPPTGDLADRLRSMEGLSKEVDLLADRIVDEVSRPTVDESALARAINGLRDAARTMAQLAAQSSSQLDRRRADLETLRRAAELVDEAGAGEADGRRVAELMERSAAGGLNEATRLASMVRRLGAALQSHSARKQSL